MGSRVVGHARGQGDQQRPSRISTFSTLLCPSSSAAPSGSPATPTCSSVPLADAPHHIGHVGLTSSSPLLDDAHLVADVGQLGQDVAGDHDRLARLAELLEQAADFDPARGSRPLAGSSSSSTWGSCSSTRARPSRWVMPRERLVTKASRL